MDYLNLNIPYKTQVCLALLLSLFVSTASSASEKSVCSKILQQERNAIEASWKMNTTRDLSKYETELGVDFGSLPILLEVLPYVFDAGTGAGQAALALAKILPEARITGISMEMPSTKNSIDDPDKLNLSREKLAKDRPNLQFYYGESLIEFISSKKGADYVGKQSLVLDVFGPMSYGVFRPNLHGELELLRPGGQLIFNIPIYQEPKLGIGILGEIYFNLTGKTPFPHEKWKQAIKEDPIDTFDYFGDYYDYVKNELEDWLSKGRGYKVVSLKMTGSTIINISVRLERTGEAIYLPKVFGDAPSENLVRNLSFSSPI